MSIVQKPRPLPGGFERPLPGENATHLLIARLREESGRQPPFSETKQLLRTATAVIERLEGELSRLGAELAQERRTAGPEGRPLVGPVDRGPR